jgi:hypothetical protein
MIDMLVAVANHTMNFHIAPGRYVTLLGTPETMNTIENLSSLLLLPLSRFFHFCILSTKTFPKHLWHLHQLLLFENSPLICSTSSSFHRHNLLAARVRHVPCPTTSPPPASSASTTTIRP